MPTPTPSKLDQQQILQAVHNEADGSLRVDATLTATIIPTPGLEVSIDAADDNIAIRNTNNNHELLINSDGSINTNIGAIALPANAAQENGGHLASIDSKLPNLNTTPVQTIQLFTKPYDAITVTYPSGTQEVYASRVGGISGTVQQTATVNYVDSTKVNLLNVAVV